jgi:short subunit dehydrogenase-like uncharacterized protein
VSFPAGEVLTVPRHLSAGEVTGWMVVGRGMTRVARLLSPVLPVVLGTLLPLAERVAVRGPEGPDEEARHDSRFTILLDAEADGGARGRLEISGRDPYGLTAEIVLIGAACLLEGDVPAGVLAPAQLVEAEGFLDLLAPHDLEYRVGRFMS